MKIYRTVIISLAASGCSMGRAQEAAQAEGSCQGSARPRSSLVGAGRQRPQLKGVWSSVRRQH